MIKYERSELLFSTMNALTFRGYNSHCCVLCRVHSTDEEGATRHFQPTQVSSSFFSHHSFDASRQTLPARQFLFAKQQSQANECQLQLLLWNEISLRSIVMLLRCVCECASTLESGSQSLRTTQLGLSLADKNNKFKVTQTQREVLYIENPLRKSDLPHRQPRFQLVLNCKSE